MNRLCGCLNALTENTSKGICIISSKYLDDNTMQPLRKPYVQNPIRSLYRINASDFREGFPAAIFEADILKVYGVSPGKKRHC
ncbi:MAG: hypothetical protein IJS39_16290 [Synergistaceae bacterium]|nr:hypothetical protein [Synergistaceae bacterium]